MLMKNDPIPPLSETSTRGRPVRRETRLAATATVVALVVIVGTLGRRTTPTSEPESPISPPERHYTPDRQSEGVPTPAPASQVLPTAGPSRQAAREIPFTQLREVLDRGFEPLGAVYFGHATIQQPGTDQVRMSFVYWSKNGEELAPTSEDLGRTGRAALAMKAEGREWLAAALADGDEAQARQAARLLSESSRLLSQGDSFHTVEISPTTDRPPVLMYQRGAPDWLTHREAARELAQAELGEPVEVVATAQDTLGAPCVFVCRNSSGREVFVRPASGEVFSERRTVAGTSRLPAVDPERDERIRDQWKDFLGGGFQPVELTLAGLRDRAAEHPEHSSQ